MRGRSTNRPGVVNNDIDLRKRFGFCEQIASASRLGQVSLNCRCTPANLLDLRARLLRRTRVAVTNHVCSRFGESNGNGGTKSRGRTSHQGCFASQTELIEDHPVTFCW